MKIECKVPGLPFNRVGIVPVLSGQLRIRHDRLGTTTSEIGRAHV